MKVYISGQITGLEAPEALKNFNKAENVLKLLGHRVVNPMKINKPGDSWKQCMITDIKALMDCDAIYMLSNWINSRGARIEFCIAKETDLSIMYEDEEKSLVYRVAVGNTYPNHL